MTLTVVAAAVLVLVLLAPARCVAEPIDDPLAPLFRDAVRSTVATVLDECRAKRRYRDEDFPLAPEQFETFRKGIVDHLVDSLGLRAWVVREPPGATPTLGGLYADHVLDTIEHHGVRMEVRVIEIAETGDRVPAVLCLPNGEGRHPGICVFSGHSNHGLRDLVTDLDSYQRGIATRLAQAGFASIAVEKIDSGYLSRTSPCGTDEEAVATHCLYWGQPIRARQLMACRAASEILAGHPRVDGALIGATGVSLGGWLAVQTALLSDRIRAVADFGMKTVSVADETTANGYSGMRDPCHIIPGMLSLCDRNLMALAYAPRPMLAGQGSRDAASSREGPRYYRRVFEEQYAKLGAEENYEYSVHVGGDSMPKAVVIDYFGRVLDRCGDSR